MKENFTSYQKYHKSELKIHKLRMEERIDCNSLNQNFKLDAQTELINFNNEQEWFNYRNTTI